MALLIIGRATELKYISGSPPKKERSKLFRSGFPDMVFSINRFVASMVVGSILLPLRCVS